jgi:hypothetical protein
MLSHSYPFLSYADAACTEALLCSAHHLVTYGRVLGVDGARERRDRVDKEHAGDVHLQHIPFIGLGLRCARASQPLASL